MNHGKLHKVVLFQAWDSNPDSPFLRIYEFVGKINRIFKKKYIIHLYFATVTQKFHIFIKFVGKMQ
jgi:hypothetical protein